MPQDVRSQGVQLGLILEEGCSNDLSSVGISFKLPPLSEALAGGQNGQHGGQDPGAGEEAVGGKPGAWMVNQLALETTSSSLSAELVQQSQQAPDGISSMATAGSYTLQPQPRSLTDMAGSVQRQHVNNPAFDGTMTAGADTLRADVVAGTQQNGGRVPERMLPVLPWSAAKATMRHSPQAMLQSGPQNDGPPTQCDVPFASTWQDTQDSLKGLTLNTHGKDALAAQAMHVKTGLPTQCDVPFTSTWQRTEDSRKGLTLNTRGSGAPTMQAVHADATLRTAPRTHFGATGVETASRLGDPGPYHEANAALREMLPHYRVDIKSRQDWLLVAVLATGYGSLGLYAGLRMAYLITGRTANLPGSNISVPYSWVALAAEMLLALVGFYSRVLTKKQHVLFEAAAPEEDMSKLKAVRCPFASACASQQMRVIFTAPDHLAAGSARHVSCSARACNSLQCFHAYMLQSLSNLCTGARRWQHLPPDRARPCGHVQRAGGARARVRPTAARGARAAIHGEGGRGL